MPPSHKKHHNRHHHHKKHHNHRKQLKEETVYSPELAETEDQEQQPPFPWTTWLVFAAVTVAVVLAIGLGVGLTARSSGSSGSQLAQNNSIRSTQTYNSVILNAPYQKNDVYGQFMDYHDGAIIRHPPSGLYYLFGMSYGTCIEPLGPDGTPIQGGNGTLSNQVFGGCSAPGGTQAGNCGDRVDHNVSCWSSPDLATWTPVRGPGPEGAIILNVLKDWPNPAVIYVAKGLWNPTTNEFVVWLFINAVTDGAGSYGVITATEPSGQWTIQTVAVSTLACPIGLDDVGFVQQKTAPYVGWMTYTCRADLSPGHEVFIEQLSPDYYSTLGTAAWSGPASLANYTEAQALFLRDGKFCLSRGICSCYGWVKTDRHSVHSPVRVH
jgi:hypothetical protein